MKRLSKWVFVITPVVLVLGLLFPLIRPAPLLRDPPRELPWQLPDYRTANTHWELGSDGRIHTEVEHFFLRDITPEMIAWFYQQLPIATVALRGKRYPLYHIFHPSEHGTLWVREAASDGSPGMGVGAMIQRDEWFGAYDSSGAARIKAFSAAGMLAIPMVAGIEIGSVQHSYTARDGGTEYRVSTIIGSELPLLGPALNWYLRTHVFHPEMLTEWQRHQVEEVSSLQFFLPHIYGQRFSGTHFALE